MKPFVKWAGGKRQILDKIMEFIDASVLGGDNVRREYRYIEPFVGGGAVFFNLAHNNVIINDLNSELINAYRVIKSEQYIELIEELKKMKEEYHREPDEYYYEVRALDREINWEEKYSDVFRAARMIFLNRTCYNGLYRVNSKGQFNTPIGRYNNPLICDEANIREIHEYLKSNNVEIMNESYEYAIRKAKGGDVIYLDPPYDYEDNDGFTQYQLSGFTFEDFVKLKNECDKAISRGAYVIISNNATEKVLKLFSSDPKYKIFYDENKLKTLRSINCRGGERKTGFEVIYWGMDTNLPQANDLEKVIKLIMAGNEALENRSYAQEIINVTTERQVAYYIQALHFLEFLGPDKKLFPEIDKIKDDEEKVRINVYIKIKKNPIFDMIVSFTNEDELVNELKKIYNLSSSTILRRLSTLNKWKKWADDHEYLEGKIDLYNN